MNPNELIPFIPRFRNARILVLGDLMVDEYIWGNVSRISPEAPVPVVSVTSESLRLGGAGNVVNNIHALGGKVWVSGIVGSDDMGRKVIHDLRRMGLETKGVVVQPGGITTVKTRIIAHNQQVVRYDREVVREIPVEYLERILSLLAERIDEVDAVLISDYGKGVICGPLARGSTASSCASGDSV